MRRFIAAAAAAADLDGKTTSEPRAKQPCLHEPMRTTFADPQHRSTTELTHMHGMHLNAPRDKAVFC